MDYFTYFAFFVILIRLWLFRLCMYSLKHFVRKFKIFANEIISTKVYWLFFRRKKEPDRVDIRMFWKRKNMIWTMFRQMITFLMVPITLICGGYRVKLNSLFFSFCLKIRILRIKNVLPICSVSWKNSYSSWKFIWFVPCMWNRFDDIFDT